MSWTIEEWMELEAEDLELCDSPLCMRYQTTLAEQLAGRRDQCESPRTPSPESPGLLRSWGKGMVLLLMWMLTPDSPHSWSGPPETPERGLDF